MACTNATLSGLQNMCDSSLGGIKRVWLAPYSAGTATLATSASTQVSITGTTSSDWKNYYLRKGSASMTSTLNKDAANGTNYVSTVLSMAFSKMETTKRVEIQAMALGDMMAVVQDSNDKYWFLGKDEPITATASTGVTGQAKGDPNQYTVELTDESLVYPYELDSASVSIFA